MALEVIDSVYGEYKKQLNDLILITLAKEYPLKIGEICRILQNEFHITVSFQAVRKSLNILAERKILTINNKKYRLAFSEAEYSLTTFDLGKDYQNLIELYNILHFVIHSLMF